MVELLSPAGSFKALKYAYEYGADAVYVGLPRYSLRARNNEFDYQKLEKAIKYAKSKNKKIYIVNNIFPHNSKIKTFENDFAKIASLGPDAIIASDPGVISLIKKNHPNLPIHLSVQANTINYATVKFWQDYGLQRIILSRELSILEIAIIKKEVPQMELEVFVHGALCMAHSGRCLLSGYMNKRDPNQGTCTNACRWKYDVKTNKTQEYYLEENMRQGEYMPIEEDQHGTYIMNSKDLCAIEHVAPLIDAKIDSLKIEGRTKSFYYAARTAKAYRTAIDLKLAEKEFDLKLIDELYELSNRGYTAGFLDRHEQNSAMQNYEHGHSKSDTKQFVGEIVWQSNDLQKIEIEVKNNFVVSDFLQIITPKNAYDFKLTNLENSKGKRIDNAKGSGHKVFIYLPFAKKINFGLLTKYKEKKLNYKEVD